MYRKFNLTRSFLLLLLTLLLAPQVNAQVVIQRCDNATGWQGTQSFAINRVDMKEGKGALVTEPQAGTSDWFRKSFSSTQTGIDDTGYLTFWLYVSNASVMEGGQVEISSSGTYDFQEYNWPLSKTDVVDGWNLVELQVNAAGQTGGGANLDSINFFRIHQEVSGPLTVMIDFIRFTPSLDPPVWPALDVPVVDNSTLDGKVMFGYQGWFNHPDDGAGLGWVHWGNFYEPINSTVDMYPDMREYGEDEKYDAHLSFPDGSMAPVYSSYNRNSVVRHMKWVRDYNLDGVFLQRFISNADNQAGMDHKDTVTVHVMEGCEKYGRVFAIMYDGVANRVEDMKADWMHLVDDIGVTDSDRYLHHRGLPLVSLWGYSVRDEATADQLAEMIDFFKNNPEPKYRASVKLGVFWNFYNQADFQEAFKEADVISPWFSGSTNYDRGQEWGDQNNVDYMPVVHPGFSWHNLKDPDPSATPNREPREGGQFLWDEVNEVIPVSAKSVYIAMFDEIDEGTAMFKLAENENQVPREGYWLPLDADGYDLPSDWYLRAASLATQIVRGNEQLDEILETPPEGIMTIRIINEKNGDGQGGMELIFPDFPDETTLEISIDGGATFPYTTPDDIGTYTITGLSAGTYQVVARHDGSSPAADMGDVTISNVYEGLPGPPLTPFPAFKQTGVRTNTSLGWRAGDHTVSHQVYFGTTDTPDSVTYQFTPSYNPGELEPNTTYYWRIIETNGTGQTQGHLWSFTTGDAGGPTDIVVLDYCDEITGWTSSNGATLDADEKQEGFASLTCTGGGTDKFRKTLETPVNTYCDEDSYFNLWLYVSDVSVFNGGGQIEISSSGTFDQAEYNWNISDLDLVDGWNEVHLRIGDASKSGNPDLRKINFFRIYQFVSEEIVTKIDFLHFSDLAYPRIAYPTNLAGIPGDQQIALTWDESVETEVKGYNVYRSLYSATGFELANSGLLTTAEYTDNDVNNGTTYYYYVRAVTDTDEESQASDVLGVTAGETSVRPGQQPFGYNLYPNPASGLCTVQFTIENATDVTMTLFDTGGRELHKFIHDEEWPAGDHTARLPLYGFSQGNYILQVKIGAMVITDKLVIE